MISFVVFSLTRAWQGFWRNAVMSLAATATMVLMLLLLAGFWIIQTGLLAGLQFTEQKVEVVAYLQHERRRHARSTDARRPASRRCPRCASVDLRQPRTRRSRASATSIAGAGPRGPDPLPRREPALRQPRGQAASTRRRLGSVGRRAARRADRPQRRSTSRTSSTGS